MLKFEMLEWSGMQITPWNHNIVELHAAVAQQVIGHLLGYFRQIERSWHTHLAES